MIHINQHNYEEFFLLYVDGELSAADRQAVEQFVQANPDLAIELEMLQQTMLVTDELVFEDKDLLYRTEATEINAHNYEEHFLLYTDNELNNDKKEKVETFVLQHPVLQEEFTLLQQTRLPAETIVFPEKESLYRKEKAVKPLFYLDWQRIAIAAVLIGLVVLLGTLVPKINPTDQNFAQQNIKKEPAVTNQFSAEKKWNRIEPLQKAVQNTDQIASVVNTINSSVSTEKKSLTESKPVTENNDRITNNTIGVSISAENTKANTVSGSANTNETATAKVIQTLPVENNTIAGIDMGKSPNNPDDTKSYFTDNTQQVVYKELDTEDDKKSLLLGSLEINKDKLRGFFRKAGSLFRTKNRDVDEKTESRPVSNTHSLK